MNNELPSSYPSKAKQKQVLDHITRLYEKLRKQAMTFILNDESHKTRSGDRYEQLNEIYWGIPNYPHQVREKHYAWFDICEVDSNKVRGLVVAREVAKKTPIVKKAKVEKSEGKRTERSAKYWGVCQICGKEHKVDIKTGLLAEHGYKVEFGYYQGSCVGSDQLPLNVSCDFLRKEYAKVDSELENLKDKADYDIHHSYEAERYDYKTLEYKIVEIKVTVAEVRSGLKSLIANWKPILENWKPFPLREIKYDD